MYGVPALEIDNMIYVLLTPESSMNYIIISNSNNYLYSVRSLHSTLPVRSGPWGICRPPATC